MTGALTAIERELRTDLREWDAVLGTSAGAVIAGLLGAGVPVSEVRSRELIGAATGPRRLPRPSYLPHLDISDHDIPFLDTLSLDVPIPDVVDTAHNPVDPNALWPRGGVVSWELLRRGPRHWRTVPANSVVTAALPPGRNRTEPVGDVVRGDQPRGWPAHPGLGLVAVDAGTGRRVVLGWGEPGSPPVPDRPFTEPEPRTGMDLADAVEASCAVPLYYRPKEIDGRRYLDGGVASSTNLDLLAAAGLDEVYVLAARVGDVVDPSPKLPNRLMQRRRTSMRRRFLEEVAAVEAAGTRVVVISPRPADLAVMGVNVMDPTRRAQTLHVAERTTLQQLR